MSTFYADETGTWQPFAGEGGGSVEKLPLRSSGGAAGGAAIARTMDDRIWDYLEPYAGGPNLAHGFYNMSRITRVPMFDTSKATNMASMFHGCSSLEEIPHFDTSKATNLGNMFHGCRSLVEIPAFDTSKATDMGGMFQGCTSLVEIPELDMSKATYLTLFAGTTHTSTQLRSLTRFRAFGATRGWVMQKTQMDAAALNEVFTNLGTASGGQTLDVRNNPGSATCDPNIATAKGWTVLV